MTTLSPSGLAVAGQAPALELRKGNEKGMNPKWGPLWNYLKPFEASAASVYTYVEEHLDWSPQLFFVQFCTYHYHRKTLETIEPILYRFVFSTALLVQWQTTTDLFAMPTRPKCWPRTTPRWLRKFRTWVSAGVGAWFCHSLPRFNSLHHFIQ